MRDTASGREPRGPVSAQSEARHVVSGWYTPVKGKCTWWRESLHDDDSHDTTVKKADKRVQCMCMVEGRGWTFTHAEVPSDCPESRRCRYYIKNW